MDKNKDNEQKIFMDKPHYYQHRKRLKERFMRAPQAVGDAELLELLLGYVIKGRDIKPETKQLLSEVRKISGIFEADLKCVKGLGPETEIFFVVLKEFINRIDYQKIEKKVIKLNLSGDVHKFLRNRIGNSQKENFMLLFLDVKNRLIGHKIVRTGFVSSVAIAARDIIENAMEQNAVGVIMAHNHPSGDCTPSLSDLEMTKKICHALRYTGVSLLDHMIVSYHDYYSMTAHGHIQKYTDTMPEAGE